MFEYENCMLLNDHLPTDIADRIEQLKLFINPEAHIVKTYMNKADVLYKEGDIKSVNKYFTKVMLFSEPESQEYRLAKTRVANV